MHQNHTPHRPVLSAEVLQVLQPHPQERYADLTAGYGGHASLILDRTTRYHDSWLVDRDPAAIAYLRQTLPGAEIRHQALSEAVSDMVSKGEQFDLVLADLGVSSLHLDTPRRGFSLRHDGPLDMRMDTTRGQTAADIVNTASAEELARLFTDYGEEPHALRIARAIVAARPLTTTTALATVVEKSASYAGYSRRHPATRVFQALRMAVNDELGELRVLLDNLPAIVAPGGRAAIISFHSLEDRLVKQWLHEHAAARFDCQFRTLTPHPITATSTELSINPRARSAKLRAAAKINT